MTDLNTVLESVGARFVTRVIVPILLAGNVAAGSYWANEIYQQQRAQGDTIVQILIRQGQVDVRVTELERRLNTPRPGPISDHRGLYTIKGLP